MEKKQVYLFDDHNLPLTVAGIRLELFDNMTGAMLDTQLSANRKPGLGAASTEWGADLVFNPVGNPVDILITDLTFQYPGNCMQSLNGETTDRIDLDLFKIPVAPLSSNLPPLSTPTDIISAVEQEPFYNTREKSAVINLVLNYTKVLTNAAIYSDSPELSLELQEVLGNWDKALHKLGIDRIDTGIRVGETLAR